MQFPQRHRSDLPDPAIWGFGPWPFGVGPPGGPQPAGGLGPEVHGHMASMSKAAASVMADCLAKQPGSGGLLAQCQIWAPGFFFLVSRVSFWKLHVAEAVVWLKGRCLSIWSSSKQCSATNKRVDKCVYIFLVGFLLLAAQITSQGYKIKTWALIKTGSIVPSIQFHKISYNSTRFQMASIYLKPGKFQDVNACRFSGLCGIITVAISFFIFISSTCICVCF